MEPDQILTYPFDTQQILRKKKALKRILLERKQERKPLRIAILGGSTTAEIKDQLELFLLHLGIAPTFYESDYNKYQEDACFPPTELQTFSPELVYIHSTNKNIHHQPSYADSQESVDQILKTELTRWKTIWDGIQRTLRCPIIQNNLEPPTERIAGNLDGIDPRGLVHFISRLNLAFTEEARLRSDLYIHDIHYLASMVGLQHWFDPSLWFMYKYALSFEAISYLCHSLARFIAALYGMSRKAVVLDLDNTLWGGIIGDDGPENIVLGTETGPGEAYHYFQQYLKKLSQRGILLTIASKNDQTIALEGLHHPNSILKNHDFVDMEIHWNPKSQSITHLAQRLNIGMDSMVFVDDNPAERELIHQHTPMVVCPEMGEDPARFVEIIDRNRFFDTIQLSHEDQIRTQLYKDETERKQLKEQFQDYETYLKSLQMVGEIAPFSSVHQDRITQLINKTNQFNLTTRRVTYDEVDRWRQDPAYITLYGRLKDRFGDHGIISVIVAHNEKRYLQIEIWLMSCRVFKRHMEFAMFDSLVGVCKQAGIDEIQGLFIPTKKNQHVVADLYPKLGFQESQKHSTQGQLFRWKIPPDYQPKNTVIQIDSTLVWKKEEPS